MTDRSRTRRSTKAARVAAARRARWLWVGALLVGAVVVALILTSTSKDPPSQLAVGEEVFQANCAACHGDQLEGSLVGPSFLNDIYAPEHHPDDAIRAAVANGVQPHHWDFGAMPPVPGLSDEDVEAVIAYVRSEQEDNGIGDDSTSP